MDMSGWLTVAPRLEVSTGLPLSLSVVKNSSSCDTAGTLVPGRRRDLCLSFPVGDILSESAGNLPIFTGEAVQTRKREGSGKGGEERRKAKTRLGYISLYCSEAKAAEFQQMWAGDTANDVLSLSKWELRTASVREKDSTGKEKRRRGLSTKSQRHWKGVLIIYW